MIADFYVRNFSCIREEASITFQPAQRKHFDERIHHKVADGVWLLKLGVIYGANAAGKTTVLEALQFFCELMTKPPSNRSSRIPYERFMLDDHSQNEDTEMRLSFYVDGTRYDASVVFNNDTILNESVVSSVGGRKATLYRRKYDTERGVTTVSFGRNLDMSTTGRRTVSGNTMNNCSVLAAFGQSNAASTQLNLIFDYLTFSIPLPLVPQESLVRYTHDKIRADKDGRLKEFLLDFLVASDFNIRDIRLVETEYKVTPEVIESMRNLGAPAALQEQWERKGSFMRSFLLFSHESDGKRFEMEEERESGGTIRLLGMATLLFELLSKNVFLMIDELETNIHYELLTYFLRSFLASSKGPSQMLVTTHSLKLLDEYFIPRDAAWFAVKDSHGAVSLTSLTDYKIGAGASAYKAYVSGKLVDIPYVGSPFFEV